MAGVKHVPEPWLRSMGHDAKVVVIDSGFDRNTPHVYPEEVANFTRSDNEDHMGHGTRVATTIACQDPMRFGIAPRCRLFVAKALDRCCDDWDSLVNAIRWSRDLGADVVCMAFTYPGRYQAINALIDDLDSRGCICLAAYDRSRLWPHSLPAALAVGCLGSNDDADLLGPAQTPHYPGSIFRGSSVATAILSGVAACAKADDPAINRTQLLDQLTR